MGLATPDQDGRAPDLVLTAEAEYAFGAAATGDQAVIPTTETLRGTHGHLHDDPRLHGIFIASGAGVRPGVKLDLVSNTDVAPTVARLLGLTLENTEGKVLDAALSDR